MKIQSLQMMRSLFAVLGLMWLTAMAFAAGNEVADAPEKSSLTTLYSDHRNAGFAVQWPVSPGGVNAVRSRLPRYAYLAFYTSSRLMQSQPLPVIHMGFFRTRAEAEKFVQDNASAFNGLQVVSVSTEEHRQLFDTSAKERSWHWLQPAAMDNLSGTQALMAEAKAHFMNEQYQQALNYYSVLSLASDRDISVWAQELVGLTYERLGQRDLALQSYRDLLASHPEGSWVARVTQRLRALETAADDNKEALRKSQYTKKNERFYWRGNLGQTYSYMERGGKYIPDQDVLSALYTHYDFTAGYRAPEHHLEVRLNGYDLADLLDHVDNDKTVVKRFYLDYTHVESGLNFVGGRQRDYDTGVFQYFDGLSVKYPLSQRWRVGASYGVPVQFSKFYDYMDREFFSVQTSYDWSQNLGVVGYVMQQTVYGETDRAAVGGRVQYMRGQIFTAVNVDYDYEFEELNLLRWQSSYRFDESNQVSLNYSRQRSPMLSATNILLGQPYLNLEQHLQSQLNRDYLLYDALVRTSMLESGSLSYQLKLDKNLQIMFDVYHSLSTDIPIFTAVEETGSDSDVVSTDAEYRYSSAGVQAVINNFFGADDTATMGFRYADTSRSSSNMVHLSERLRLFGGKLYLTPRVHVKYTQDKLYDSAQTNLRGSLALIYRPWRNAEFRLEMGNESVRDLDEKNNIEFSYLYAGYHVRF